MKDGPDIARIAALIGDPARVTGHTHRPAMAERNGALHLNPGSACPRRFKLPVTLATLDLAAGPLMPELHELVPPG